MLQGLDPEFVIVLDARPVEGRRYVCARNLPRFRERLEDASRFVTREAADAYIRSTARLRRPNARIVEVRA